MRRNKEVIGLSTEIVGLTLLLIASLWQIVFTDWLDSYPVKAQYYIQENANISLLRGIATVSQALNEGDLSKRNKLLDEAKRICVDTESKLVEDREATTHVVRDQGKPFKVVRKVLFVLGALLIIVGKISILKFKIGARSNLTQSLE